MSLSKYNTISRENKILCLHVCMHAYMYTYMHTFVHLFLYLLAYTGVLWLPTVLGIVIGLVLLVLVIILVIFVVRKVRANQGRGVPDNEAIFNYRSVDNNIFVLVISGCV